MLADTCAAMVTSGLVAKEHAAEHLPEHAILKQTAHDAHALQGVIHKIEKVVKEVLQADEVDPAHGVREAAKLAHDELLPLMEQAREKADRIEDWCGDKMWPLPRYTELLFS